MISSHYQCSTSQLYFTVRGKTCNNFNSCQCLLGKEWKNVTWDDWNRDMMMFHLYNGDIMPINICTVSQSGILLCFCQGNSMGKRLCRLLYVNTPPKTLHQLIFLQTQHICENDLVPQRAKRPSLPPPHMPFLTMQIFGWNIVCAFEIDIFVR